MAESEETKLLPESHHHGEVFNNNKKHGMNYSKLSLSMLAVIAVGALAFSTVNTALGSGKTLSNGNSKSDSNHPSNTQKGCKISPTKLEEIQFMQENITKIIDYVRYGSGIGSSWRKLATFVDKFGSRFTGTKNLEDSIDYMIQKLKEEGLENVHGEEVMVPQWVRGDESAEMLKPRYQKLFMLGLGGSVSTPPEGITAEILVVRNFSQLFQLPDEEVKGKIVVYNQNYEGYGRSVRYRRLGAVEAAKKGAVASLIRSITAYSISSPHTGWQDYEKNITKIPTACITVENAEMFQRYSDNGEKVEVRLIMNAQTHPYVKSRNIVAEIKGSHYPEQVVIVSGHIDSWDVGHGAQDDGGGMMISIEALSVLNALGIRPKRTLRAVLWTAEETGLEGAAQYEKDHQEETKNWSLIMESDMGTFDPLGIIFSGQNEESKCIMKEISKFLPILNTPTVKFSKESGPDIIRWTKTGIPGAILLNKNNLYFNYHHTDADTMTHVDSLELDMCTIVWTVFSYGVANLEDMLKR